MAIWCQVLETLVTGSIKPNKGFHRPFLLGVAGGSGSGKTYFAKNLKNQLKDQCEIVFQDNFYIDQSHKFDFDGGAINFDHPDSIDFKTLAECLKVLKGGSAVEIPIYDFATHKRLAKTLNVEAKKIIIVDGILIFHVKEVRDLFDEMIFFETPEELRFQRRLERDVKERGRTPDGVKSQFLKQVKPMHDLFVEPSKAYANKIVKDLGDYSVALNDYCLKLSQKI